MAIKSVVLQEVLHGYCRKTMLIHLKQQILRDRSLISSQLLQTHGLLCEIQKHHENSQWIPFGGGAGGWLGGDCGSGSISGGWRWLSFSRASAVLLAGCPGWPFGSAECQPWFRSPCMWKASRNHSLGTTIFLSCTEKLIFFLSPQAEQNKILKASEFLEVWNSVSLLYVQEKTFVVGLLNTRKEGISPASRAVGMLARS